MGINVGISGSEKDAYGSDRQLGLGEVPYSNYAPRMDLAYRLAQMANKQGAQSNLMFGGPGYGGSFETADQRAARANGQNLNSKPYGGWGGYGSGNPVLNWDPTGTRPDWNNGVPVYPATNPGDSGSGGGDVVTGGPPIPLGDGGATPVYTPGGGGASTPVPTPPNIPGYTPPPVAGGPPVASLTAGGGNPNAPIGGKAMFAALQNDPRVKQVQSALQAAGITNGPEPMDILNSLSGNSPDALIAHYKNLVQQSGEPTGHNVFVQSHGTLGRVLPGQAGKTPAGWEDVLGGKGGGGLTPAGGSKTSSGGQRASYGAGGNDYEALGGMLQNAMAQADGGANSTADDSMGGFWKTLQDGVGAITNSPAFKEWVAKQSWEGGADGTGGKTPSKAPYTGENLNFGLDDGSSGGSIDQPPKEGESIYRTNKDGHEEMWNGHEWVLTAGGGGAGGGNMYGNAGMGGGPPGSQGPPTVEKPTGGDDGNGDVNQGNPGYFAYPAWGTDYGSKTYTEIDPVTGEKVTKVTPPKYQWDFNQGQNGGATPDAWSTSAPWRPEAPTGGLYGGYTELASGAMTPYENRIGEGWQGLATNPNGWADDDYYKQLAEYQKTPGKGIDEAYDAYNKMLQGNGYSDAEKGAIEGSAVRGVSQGFQRGADDMRRQAARTGQAGSAYAAMASMTPQFGATLGETNRQNQIKFADEAQRRQEVGGQGMTNVAGLASQKAQFGLNAGSQYANELARRKEAGIRGMGDYAAFGRGLQQQGLSGLNDLMKQSNAQQQGTYAMIANLLNQNTGTANLGSSSGWGWGAGVGAGG